MSDLYKGPMFFYVGSVALTRLAKDFGFRETAVNGRARLEVVEFAGEIDARVTYIDKVGGKTQEFSRTLEGEQRSYYSFIAQHCAMADHGRHVTEIDKLYNRGGAPVVAEPVTVTTEASGALVEAPEGLGEAADKPSPQDPALHALVLQMYNSIHEKLDGLKPLYYVFFSPTGLTVLLRNTDGSKTIYRSTFELDLDARLRAADYHYQVTDGEVTYLPKGIPSETKPEVSQDERARQTYRTNIALIAVNLKDEHKALMELMLLEGPLVTEEQNGLAVDFLTKCQLAVPVIFAGESGYVAATQAAADVFRFSHGDAATLADAFAYQQKEQSHGSADDEAEPVVECGGGERDADTVESDDATAAADVGGPGVDSGDQGEGEALPATH